MRIAGVLFLLAAACRTNAIHEDARPIATATATATVTASATVSVAEAPPPAPPPVTKLSHDEVAELVLRDYDSASHRVKTKSVGDGGVDVLQAIDVTASNGDVMHTYVDATLGKGGVHVEELRGEGWASGDLVAWVVVGTQPGLCSVGQGFLALLQEKRVLAIAPWEGSCATPYRASFVTAAGRGLLLEEDGSSGEDGASEQTNRIWLVSGARWKRAGSVRRTFEETWTHAIAGTTRKMDSTIAGDASGLVVSERWHFTSDSTQKTTHRTRAVRYTLRGDSLIAPPLPDPTP
ncbi:MAG TPA: hypothetical protein VGH28_18435 [Polyangiaceae bacterium]